MNTTDFNGKQYTMKDNGDGSITLVPVVVKVADGDWTPVEHEHFWFVDSDAEARIDSWASIPMDRDKASFHNIFPTEAQAKKAAEYMRRSNAIIRACLLVDPDFVPEWGVRLNYVPLYSSLKRQWLPYACEDIQEGIAYVSTREKAEQVYALLTKWGVK